MTSEALPHLRSASPGGPWRRVGRALWRGAGAGLLLWAGIAGWPHLRTAADVLVRADHARLIPAFAFQLTALALLSAVYRAALLAAGAPVRYWQVNGIALRAGAVSRLLPAGGAAAGLFAVRRLRRAGVTDGSAVAGVLLHGVITMSMLAAVVTLLGTGSPARLSTWVTGGAVATTALVVWRCRSVAGHHLARLGAHPRLQRAGGMWGAELRGLSARPVRGRPLAGAVGYATAAWVCEIVALWLAVAAVAGPLPLRAVALSLGAANAAAALPHTPGGVGVVEAAMTGAFMAAGLDAGVALGGVLAYRAVGFWLPVAVGGTLLAADVLGGRGEPRWREAAP